MSTSEPYRAWVNGKEYAVETLAELRTLVRKSREDQFGEFGLSQGDLPIHNFFVLFNRRRAWPTYTFKIDKKCFSVRNSAASEDEEIQFKWMNGQVDLVSATCTVTSAQAVRAIEYFFKTHKLDPDIEWHQDF